MPLVLTQQLGRTEEATTFELVLSAPALSGATQLLTFLLSILRRVEFSLRRSLSPALWVAFAQQWVSIKGIIND